MWLLSWGDLGLFTKTSFHAGSCTLRTAGCQCSNSRRGQKAKGGHWASCLPQAHTFQLVGAESTDKGTWVLLIQEALFMRKHLPLS